jgi:hypothetical protein
MPPPSYTLPVAASVTILVNEVQRHPSPYTIFLLHQYYTHYLSTLVSPPPSITPRLLSLLNLQPTLPFLLYSYDDLQGTGTTRQLFEEFVRC